jgi:hypothetical protein
MKSGIIYNGPSLLDGKPIVVIATFSNRNTKTGAVVQTYILRSDINPLEASKTGEDFSICGDCTMRGEVTTDPARKQAKGRRCYVNLGQGVLIVFKSRIRPPLAAGVSSASAHTATPQRFPRGFGKPCFPRPKLTQHTHIKADGVPILRCKARTITRRRSRIGPPDAGHSALFQTLATWTRRTRPFVPHQKKQVAAYNAQPVNFARDRAKANQSR